MYLQEINALVAGDTFKFQNEDEAPIYVFKDHGKNVRWHFYTADRPWDIRTSVRSLPVFIIEKSDEA